MRLHTFKPELFIVLAFSEVSCLGTDVCIYADAPIPGVYRVDWVDPATHEEDDVLNASVIVNTDSIVIDYIASDGSAWKVTYAIGEAM